MDTYNLCMHGRIRASKNPTTKRQTQCEIAAANKETIALSDNQSLSFMSVCVVLCVCEHIKALFFGLRRKFGTL